MAGGLDGAGAASLLASEEDGSGGGGGGAVGLLTHSTGLAQMWRVCGMFDGITHSSRQFSRPQLMPHTGTLSGMLQSSTMSESMRLMPSP